MAYTLKGAINPIGYPAINLSTPDTVKQVDLGTILEGIDPLYGMGEFIYLAGVASTTVGSLVTYDPVAGTTTLTTAAGNTVPQPVAVSMAATTAGTFGWYQITGSAAVKTTGTPAVDGAVFTLAAGAVGPTAVAGTQVLGAKFSSLINVPSAGFSLVTMNRPCRQGAIT